jgi:hypothetical protein
LVGEGFEDDAIVFTHCLLHRLPASLRFTIEPAIPLALVPFGSRMAARSWE